MRTATLLTIFAALLVAGCTDHDSARRLKRMDEQIAFLESERAERRAEFATRMESIDQIASQVEAIGKRLTNSFEQVYRSLVGEMRIEVAAQFEVYARTNLNRHGPLAARPAPIAKPAPALKRGVPATVYDQIAAEAARDWPGNFTMQTYMIDMQIESYQKLNATR